MALKKVRANFKNSKKFAWYDGRRVYNDSGAFYLKRDDEPLGSWMIEVKESAETKTKK